jgi:hypothetical protein
MNFFFYFKIICDDLNLRTHGRPEPGVKPVGVIDIILCLKERILKLGEIVSKGIPLFYGIDSFHVAAS